jgi:hypothetical protein
MAETGKEEVEFSLVVFQVFLIRCTGRQTDRKVNMCTTLPNIFCVVDLCVIIDGLGRGVVRLGKI